MEAELHLRRGRPLAAFNSLLSTRLHNSGSFNLQLDRQSFYDPQNLLSNLTETEESIISSVRYFFSQPYAIELLDFLCICIKSCMLMSF